jgi:transposase
MEGSPFLPLPEGMLIDQVQFTETGLHIAVVATLPTSRCPLCAQASSSIQSSYRRSVRAGSCGGRQVQLALPVRQCFCRKALCPRKVLPERMPQCVERMARG